MNLARHLTNAHLADLASGLAEKCGFRVTRATNSLRAKRSEALSRLGIKTVLDIGANTGQWACELRTCGYRGRIISFEPAPEPFARLKALAQRDKELVCVHAALGDRDGRAELLITNAEVNSSFRMPVRDRISSNGIEVKERAEVSIRRLDSVLPELTSIEGRFYLKVDTQGFEREVLAGASETLRHTDAIEIELSLVELYEKQALLPEIWETLARSGLRPAWLERGYRDAGDIWLFQVDGLFIREEAWTAKARSKDLNERY